jgi:hypothetical protein
MDYVYPNFVEYDRIVSILVFVDLRSTVHRQYICGLAACQISRSSLLVAVGPEDQESFRMAAILLGYF